nr:hypothetical protein [Tanacetum cinerariifolium]
MSLEESNGLNLSDAESVDPILEASSLPKFDMHLYKYSLTETNVKWLTKCYGIPADLHPRPASEDMTMNTLPNDDIGLYAHHFQQGGLRLGVNRATYFEMYRRSLDIIHTVPLFRMFYKLCKQGNWFSFQNRVSKNYPFPKPSEYNASDVAKIREVVIALRKLYPSLLYVASLSHVWKHAVLTMAEFLQLLNFKGCKVTAGEILPPGSARVTHLSNPAEPLEDIPPKTEDMMVAKIPCHKVLDDKQKKKRKTDAKAMANVPSANIQAERVAGKEGARKKRRVRVGTLVHPDSKHVSSPLLLNHAKPLKILANEEERVQENVDAAFANKGHGDNEGGLSGLQTQPSPVCLSALTEEHANLVYAHESCKDVKARYKECKKELVKAQSTYDEKASAYDQLEKFVAEAGKGEMVRRRIINECLPTFVHRLHHSNEYKRSMGEAFSLAIGKGFIDGISIGRKDPDIQTILRVTPNANSASSDIFMETYEQLFDKRYPYVDKVARMHLLNPSGLQNIMPDETGPTPGGAS